MERDESAPVADASSLSLRPATPDDKDFLVSVYASTRADELAQVNWTDAQKMAFLRMQYGAQYGEYYNRFPDAEYSVILWQGQPAGRIWIGRNEEEIRLLDIALLPAFQRRGIGALLVRRLMAEAEAAGKPLRHMIFVLNPGARRFYERLGFAVIGDVGAYQHMQWPPPPAAASGDDAQPISADG